MTSAQLRIATRSSAQARTQAELVAAAIEAAHPGTSVELVFVETVGDQRLDVPLHTLGGQGVFVKEVQRAVLDGRADVAAHSAKDLPSSPQHDDTAALAIGAFCARRSAADALIGASLDSLERGATVATGSVRRQAQLHAVRPDLRFVDLRGNIQTRLTKVPVGGALVMAVAALEILGLTHLIDDELPVDRFVPAIGQGCVAVECRADDDATMRMLAAIDHSSTRQSVEIERAFLATLGSGCSLPVGAHVRDDRLIAFIADPERGRHLQRSIVLAAERVADVDAAHARRLAVEMQRDLAGFTG